MRVKLKATEKILILGGKRDKVKDTLDLRRRWRDEKMKEKASLFFYERVSD